MKSRIIERDHSTELICEHGVGHPIFAKFPGGSVHGCDSCCDKYSYPWFKAEKDKDSYVKAMKEEI